MGGFFPDRRSLWLGFGADAPDLGQRDRYTSDAIEGLPYLLGSVGDYYQPRRFCLVQGSQYTAHERVPLRGQRNAAYVVTQPVAIASPAGDFGVLAVVDQQSRSFCAKDLL